MDKNTTIRFEKSIRKYCIFDVLQQFSRADNAALRKILMKEVKKSPYKDRGVSKATFSIWIDARIGEDKWCTDYQLEQISEVLSRYTELRLCVIDLYNFNSEEVDKDDKYRRYHPQSLYLPDLSS